MVNLHIITPGTPVGPCWALQTALALYTQKAGIDVTIVNPTDRQSHEWLIYRHQSPC
jgi:hypothetical protein